MTLKSIAARIDRLRSYDLLDRPVFILTPPRSGSTFLFEILCRFEEVWAWHAETDALWYRLFPYDRLEEPSDHVGADEWTPTAARRLRREFYRYALWARQERGSRRRLGEELRLARIRYVDKTLANCFHAGFLKRVFPDALFLVLLRDGRPTVSSMIEGWRDPERFVNDRIMPYLRASGAGLERWCYSAPPGWHDVVHRPLEEICAWSWGCHVRAALDAVADLPGERTLFVRYEELVASPLEVAEQVGRFCGLAWHDRVRSFVAGRPLSRTTVSAPEPEKWRRMHGEQVERIIPMIRDLMRAVGYSA
jgi:hypothetical protein